ncbi:potassium voltage-gated channel subfamily A member 1-like [Montipora capricornis]|uniref:potassium voltage-gated channel subfamily A member 1-like n=1 Tax=Montipora capricornis TaxID=246305 RepID=UPI0035F142EE
MISSNESLENWRSQNGGTFEHRHKIQINVRGEMFETYEQTLSRFPRTLLGSQSKRRRYYDPLRREYYFDRDKAVFNSILFYYQSNGILSKPETIPYEMFSSELKFFQLEGNFQDTDEEIGQELPPAQQRVNESLPCWRKVKRTRRNVWQFFEQPVTHAERTFKKFCLILTVLSLVCLCLETLPSIQHNQIHVQRKNTTTQGIQVDYGIIWSAVEVVFTIWFSVEFVLRLLCAPKITKFVFSFNTIVDITALSPFYIKVIVERVTQKEADSVVPFHLLKITRLVRLLKLKRYSVSIRLLFETIIDSGEHMRLFALCIIFNTVLLSSFVYFSEGEGSGAQFTSIPSTFWFTIITLSSVGYGDFVPTSAAGKLVGSFCCVGGTVAMFCFTPVLFTEFRKSWQRYYAEMLEIRARRGVDQKENNQIHYRSQSVRLRCQDEVSQALLDSRNGSSC